MKTFNQINTLEPKSLMILDSLNLGFRYAHSGAKDFAVDYMKTVDSLRKSYHCQKLIICGDMGSSSYRKGIYPEYKANRKKKYEEQTEEEAEKFANFFKEMQEILVAYEEAETFPVLRFPGVEADDLYAYVCSKRKKYSIEKIWAISSDADWDLLVDEHISRFSYVTRKEITYENWSEKYDFTRDEYISIKCLMGDSGDNVLGVPGIGPKRARELVQTFGSTFDIISALPITSRYKYITALNDFGADNLMLNYKLMDLVTFCDEAIGPENCKTIDNILENYLG